MKSHQPALATFVSLLIMLGLPGMCAAQNGVRSLPFTDSEDDPHAGNSALIGVEKLLYENRRLRTELEDARKTFAANTAETEIFRRQVKELTLRMEALGGSTASPSALEQRVLQAANVVRHTESSRQDLSKRLIRLAQIAREYAKKPDADAKMVLESELRQVDEVLAQSVAGNLLDPSVKEAPAGTDLLDGKISTIERNIPCVVINLGAKQGVKVGMPFQVRRGDKLVGYIRVVDARQGFAGAIIQNLVSEKDPVRVGDTVKVDAQLN